MTVNERLTRLEGVVERLALTTAAFIKSATEFQNDVTRILKAHDESIRRLDAMVTRFDKWLRGQGPSNGHKRRSQ
jgi:hypothetical protein